MSACRISPVSPTPSSVTTSGIQEAVITNAAYHARFMPKNLSVPNLPSISIAGSNGSKSSVSTSSTTASTGLIRVQVCCEAFVMSEYISMVF